MNNHLQTLYRDTLAKYKKYSRRLHKGLQNGQFFEYSRKKQQQIQLRIAKLRKRLATLKWQIKIAAASGAIAMTVSISTSQAQQLGPFAKNDADNPLPTSSYLPIYGHSNPSVVDIDGDGDLDVFIGTRFGSIAYLKNEGTASDPKYISVFGTENPANGIDPGNFVAPTFVDIDDDGDFDLVLGEQYQYPFSPQANIRYYENTGDRNNPVFVETESTVGSIYSDGYHAHPEFVDIDDDGDFDAFIGSVRNTSYESSYDFRETIKFWRNTGTKESPDFDAEEGENNIVSLVNPQFGGTVDYATPTFVDIDDDGDYDMFVGDVSGSIRFYKNSGTKSNPVFDSESTADNPLGDFELSGRSSPAFGDFDNDGDFDAISGSSYYEHLHYYENIGSATSPEFVERVSIDNPFKGLRLGYDASPAFADLDGDTDLDIVLGSKYSNQALTYLENKDGMFAEADNADLLPTDFNNDQQKFHPALVDIDGDNDADLFLGIETRFGTQESYLQYYRNEGGQFQLQEAIVSDTSTYESYSPTFGDVDGDGDYDLVLGGPPQGKIKYYENQGTKTSPVFVQATGADNPFNNISLDTSPENYAEPVLVDIDHDDDLDLIIGITDDQGYSISFPEDGALRFFENQNGEYVEVTGTTNPFDTIRVGKNADPAFADLDRDGDLDIFIGDQYGDINYFENLNTPPSVISDVTALAYKENDAALALDANLVLADSDNDDIVSATISITENFEAGFDELTFTPQAGVTGSFDALTGVLTLTGRASLDTYQTILRSVAFVSSSENPSDATRTIQMSATDFDATTPTSAVFNVTVSPENDLPIINNIGTLSVAAGGSIELDLCELINDADNDFEELNINVSASSDAVITIEGCVLTIDYGDSGFSGMDEITLEACDPTSSCATNSVQVEVAGENPGPLTIYTAVSPNGDGMNDWWQISSLSTPNKIEIYNRWGDLVKTLNNYVSEENNELDDLSPATYFYKIESPQGSYNGYIVIKK